MKKRLYYNANQFNNRDEEMTNYQRFLQRTVVGVRQC